MMKSELSKSITYVENRIYTIRRVQVMLDFHLAVLYDVETKRINVQVKRNIKRFPSSFMFLLSASEWDNLQSQIATTVFDAYELTSKIIRSAQQSIVLIDNYIDETTLIHLSKKGDAVKLLLLAKTISKQLILDVQKVNEQYGNFELKPFNKSHDRFLIIEDNEIYHLGASLKDLGKRWFAFSKLDRSSVGIKF